MHEILKRIEEKCKEQQSLIQILKMWNEVRIQGINPDDVATFGFEENMMTPKECSEERRKILLFRHTPLHVQKYNFVRLKNDTKIRLNPMIDIPNKDT